MSEERESRAVLSRFWRVEAFVSISVEIAQPPDPFEAMLDMLNELETWEWHGARWLMSEPTLKFLAARRLSRFSPLAEIDDEDGWCVWGYPISIEREMPDGIVVLFSNNVDPLIFQKTPVLTTSYFLEDENSADCGEAAEKCGAVDRSDQPRA